MRGAAAIAVAALLVAATSGRTLAQATSSYRTADPRALVHAWVQVPREDRGAIAEAIAARRAESLPAPLGRGPLRRRAGEGLRLRHDRRAARPRRRRRAGRRDHRRRRPRAPPGRHRAAHPRRSPRRAAAARHRPLRVRSRRPEDHPGGARQARPARDIHVIEPFLAHADTGVRVVAAGALAMLGDERGLALVLAGDDDRGPPASRRTRPTRSASSPRRAAGAAPSDPRRSAGRLARYALLATGRARAGGADAGAATRDARRVLADGRSRTVAEWAVDRLTDLGDSGAADVLRRRQQAPDARRPISPPAAWPCWSAAVSRGRVLRRRSRRSLWR